MLRAMRRELSFMMALFLGRIYRSKLSVLSLRTDKDEAGFVVWRLLFMF